MLRLHMTSYENAVMKMVATEGQQMIIMVSFWSYET